MDRFDNPLMNGPRRVDRNTRLLPAVSMVEEEAPVYKAKKKSVEPLPETELPAYNSPDFKSEIHGLLAPPRVAYSGPCK